MVSDGSEEQMSVVSDGSEEQMSMVSDGSELDQWTLMDCGQDDMNLPFVAKYFRFLVGLVTEY